MNTFFTSDTHFNHRNILQHANRPFASVEEMDRVMIERWNEVVGPNDTVWHLGDFTLSDRKTAESYFALLNGRIKVVGCAWHHDKRWVPPMPGETQMLSKSGHKVYIAQPIVVLNQDPVIVLSHYPQALWDRKHYGAYHFHGHSHGNYHAPWTDTEKRGSGSKLYDGPPLILDVGVDVHDFRPITFEQAVAFIEARNAREYAVPNENTPVVSEDAAQELHDALIEYTNLK